MTARCLTLVPLTLALLTFSCADDRAVPRLPNELSAFYDVMIGHATAFDERDGEWTEDYGDAPFYGIAFYARHGAERSDDRMLATAERARAYDRSVVAQANADQGWYLENLEEALMAALGLIEHADATSDTADLPLIDDFIDNTNNLVSIFGDYLPSGAALGSFALSTYGPTTITAAAALLDLQYAVYVDTPRRQERIDTALRIVRAIDQNAWDGDRYLFQPGEEQLYLYPNAMMIIVLCRLHELTGDDVHITRARAVADAIQPLRDDMRGGYRSPYSAEYMGATTDDYTTLSSQNYLALAFALLYQRTREVRWFDEAVFVLELGRSRLYDATQGRVLHHWMDGRVAQPGDPEYWCSGCNLQYLYVLWYMQNRLA